jgi:hypothetical protein
MDARRSTSPSTQRAAAPPCSPSATSNGDGAIVTFVLPSPADRLFIADFNGDGALANTP